MEDLNDDTLEENAKLICKALGNIWEEEGYETLYYKFADGMDIYPTSMEYHSSWDWLIETCKVMKKMYEESELDLPYDKNIEFSMLIRNIHASFLNYDIIEVYLKVVETAKFILETTK